jgi:hypothetical protein
MTLSLLVVYALVSSTVVITAVLAEDAGVKRSWKLSANEG